MKRPRPWGDYSLRVLACVLLLVTGYVLVSRSTFGLRLRDDVPPFIPGLGGAEGAALVLAAVLATLPLLMGKRFLGAFLVSAFILTGIGAYWWTTIPWDELVTESDFATPDAPGLQDHLLVLAPAFIAAFYACVSRASVLRADYLARGAESDEARRAAAASFLAGTAALVMSSAMAGALMWMITRRELTGVPGLRGVPALVAAALLIVLAYVFGSGSFLVGRKAVSARAEDGEPDADAGTKTAASKKRVLG